MRKSCSHPSPPGVHILKQLCSRHHTCRLSGWQTRSDKPAPTRWSCTTGDDWPQNTRTAIAVRESLAKRLPAAPNQYHLHHRNKQQHQGSAIRATVRSIDSTLAEGHYRSGWSSTSGLHLLISLWQKWMSPKPQWPSCRLLYFEWQLQIHGYGIYSIDYTQDFSGVLD